MEQYAIYLRKSRKDEEAELRGDGETLYRHERALLDLAKRYQFNITEIYREIVSGETIAARPVMQQLLSEVEQGLWSGVLVMEVERLARGNTIDQGIVAQTFKFSNTKIITPMKTYDPNDEYDEEYFEFGLFMSRREYKTINRRLQRGRVASVNEGKYVANRPPYGYIRKKLEHDKGYTLEPHPEQSEVVKMIFDLYTSGESLPDGSIRRLGPSLIVRKLNEMHIAPQRGNIWVVSSVKDILTNPVYIGKIRWNRRPVVKKMTDGQVSIERPRSDKCIIAEGLHEGIVDEPVFNLAQQYMKTKQTSPVKSGRTVKNPLAGLVVCGKCGRHMVRRPYTKDQAPADVLICPVTGCLNVSSSLSLVEDKVIDTLKKWLENYKLNWDTDPNKNVKPRYISTMQRSIKKLDSESEVLKKQLNSAHDFLEQGVYNIDTFLERSKAISERINAIEKEKDQLTSQLDLAVKRMNSQKEFVPKVEKLLEVYSELPDAKAKNEMLKEVLEKVVYNKEDKCRWHNSPDNFEIVLYPKLPKKQLR